jgi:hypothetical protein
LRSRSEWDEEFQPNRTELQHDVFIRLTGFEGPRAVKAEMLAEKRLLRGQITTIQGDVVDGGKVGLADENERFALDASPAVGRRSINNVQGFVNPFANLAS